MEEKKKFTHNDANKLDWRLVARAYSVLIALVTDKLFTKSQLELLNNIVAEAQTEDMELFGYPYPQSMYMLMMRRINRVITDRLVNYTPDTATKAETGEILDLCEIRNALDGVNIREFDYALTIITAKNGDLIPDKLREYRIALAVAAPDSANAIINDIEIRCGTYAGLHYGAPMSQPPMQQPWQYGYQPGSPYATMYPGNPLYRTAVQSVNPFAQRVPQQQQPCEFTRNPYQSAMTDTLGGDDGKRK